MPDRPLRLLVIDGQHAASVRFRSLLPEEGCVVDDVADLQEAMAAVRRCRYDAVVVDGSEGAARALARLRRSAADCALLVLRSTDGATVPLDPQDVGIQSTLDLDDLDRRTLPLTLHLAVERHRVARLMADAQASRIAGAAALRDPLTGLVSGERLLEDIDRMIADAVRFHRPLTVAVVTIDDADGLLDRIGQAGMDCVHAQVAGLVIDGLRTTDLVGRLSEGQLVLAMTATTPQAALLPIRRLQEAVRSAPSATPLSRQPVTVSVGVCELTGLMAVDELVWSAMKAAEEAGRTAVSGLVLAGAHTGAGQT